jgi:hypothetical protein
MYACPFLFFHQTALNPVSQYPEGQARVPFLFFEECLERSANAGRRNVGGTRRIRLELP